MRTTSVRLGKLHWPWPADRAIFEPTSGGLANYFMGATQFRLLTTLGLREHHSLLDFGCGSLRAGRLLIPYLLPGRYYGLEPNRCLIEDGINT
jgi:SAM-dependent methyltransferase